jgi:hypothetical protein
MHVLLFEKCHRADRGAQVLEHLLSKPSKHKALSSSPRISKEKREREREREKYHK